MSRFVIVTGGTKGIGKAVVEKYLANGDKVITCSSTETAVEALKNDLETYLESEQLWAVKADLSTTEGVKAFGEFVLENADAIDVLVNNVGVFFPGKISEEEEGKLDAMWNLNVKSVYTLTRQLLPMIIKSGGDIFNVCSIASITAYPNGGSYSITKFALYGMTKVLREEMKEENVRVTAVLPGATFTSSWEGVDLPLDRFIKAEDVANSIFEISNLSKNTVVEDIVIRPQLGDI